jgi:CcmD family protein
MLRWRIDVKRWTRRATAAIAAFVVFGLSAAGAIAQTQEGFVPASEVAKETLPALPLVYVAYGFVWFALVVYVFMLWRKLDRVERELAEVSARLRHGK